MANPPDARDILKTALSLHGQGRIDEALATAREAIGRDPAFADAWTYLGTTLITRKLAFEEGLEALGRAAAIAPEDAGVHYTLGWCSEFVAYRLEKQAARPYRDPYELLQAAELHLRRCLELQPEPKLREDAEDLLEAVKARF